MERLALLAFYACSLAGWCLAERLGARAFDAESTRELCPTRAATVLTGRCEVLNEGPSGIAHSDTHMTHMSIYNTRILICRIYLSIYLSIYLYIYL